MHIAFEEPRALDLSGVQALLATSANGVRALIHHQPDAAALNLPVLCVGDATADAARQAGFFRIGSAGGDVESLAALVRDTLSPPAGRLVHVAGRARTGDLAARLAPAGFAVTVEVLYRATPIARLDAETIRLVNTVAIDAVLLYSPRSARFYVERIAAEGLDEKVRSMDHFCLSQAVDAALAPLAIAAARRHIAAQPTQAALFSMLTERGK